MTALDSTPSTAPAIQGDIRPDLHPRGVNHLAISTTEMKGQLTFWAEVLGCPTKALYWMHGVDNTFHGFVELSSESYVAFVQHPDNRSEIEYGVTHAGNPGGVPGSPRPPRTKRAARVSRAIARESSAIPGPPSPSSPCPA